MTAKKALQIVLVALMAGAGIAAGSHLATRFPEPWHSIVSIGCILVFSALASKALSKIA
jgi:hypothetical protein